MEAENGREFFSRPAAIESMSDGGARLATPGPLLNALYRQFTQRRRERLYPGSMEPTPWPKWIKDHHGDTANVAELQASYTHRARATYMWDYLLTKEEKKSVLRLMTEKSAGNPY